MKNCPACNHTNDENAIVCSKCAQTMNQVTTNNKGIPSVKKPNHTWKIFNNNFWILFVLHFISHLTVVFLTTSESVVSIPHKLVWSLIALQALTTIAMIINVGWYSYIFSKKKWTIIYGLFGLPFVGTIGMLFAYIVVQKLYKSSTGVKNQEWENVLFKVFTALAGLMVIIYLIGFIRTSLSI